METGDKIRLLRKKKNITQDDMASSLNISQRAYSKIETGEVTLKIDRLEEIAKILQVSVNDLLTENGYQLFENVHYSQIGSGKVINQVNEKERELYEKIIQRQQEEINYLKGLIDVLKK